MNAEDKTHSNNLREALLALYHSGPNGFEGLLSIVLAGVTGQSFRLAKSGTQRGRDGDSAFDGGATYFEGKRYDKSPSSREILEKLSAVLIDDSGQVDLWILGATCEVAAQTVSDMRNFCARSGIGAVVLDWSNNDFGALLVSVVTAGDKAKDFIEAKLKGTPKAHLIHNALIAIDHFAEHPDLPARLEALRRELSTEESALGLARSGNRRWLNEVFSSRRSARAEFGQPLAPLHNSGLPAVARTLGNRVRSAFTGQPEGLMYAIVGDEGVGKSWLVASTWLTCDPASILIISPAEELLAPGLPQDFEAYLIDKLIKQTGGHRSVHALERWRRRIRGWRANPMPENVRLTMVFDGLNQPLKTDWAKLLDHAAAELEKLGGCLVVTTRSTHWAQMRHAVLSRIAQISVDQWTVSEVGPILQQRGIEVDKVNPAVLQSLRNPRILGIATDLLADKDIEHFEQLSVGRLMFEYLRMLQTTGAASMHGSVFAELLKSLANETLRRISGRHGDDIRIFNTTNHKALEEVASLRFFVHVKGSVAEYEIKQDGLNLGLALSLIHDLEKELRNHRDPRERLLTILEPISALDAAASVVFLAAQVACLDQETSLAVTSALLEQFVSLQNLPNDESDAFAVLARSAPESFLEATRNVYSSDWVFPNSEWLLFALLEQRDDARVWAEISKAVKEWLVLYSLAPERMMFKTPRHNTPEEVNEERNKCQVEIESTMVALTNHEQSYLAANLGNTEQWRYEPLHRTAFYLLAGKPLADFADTFVRWAFLNSLVLAIHRPFKEFRELIRFNFLDWKETREALLAKVQVFEGDKSSSVGKWATVGILRATGDVDDAKKAEELAEWLTRDREDFPGWSLIEQYCSTDPCDPRSTKPDNVDATAQMYRTRDPSKLACRMGQTQEDNFFNMARTGVARFHRDDAVFAHRALADDVLTRTGFSRTQGALALLEHSGALTKAQAIDLLAAGQAGSAGVDDGRHLRDEWLTAQYFVFTALPHLSPDEQLEAVAGIPGNRILLDILDALVPASEATTESVLERAFQSKDEEKQGSVLAAINYSRPALSARSLSIVCQLINSNSALVRGHALGVAAANADQNLLREVVSSGWAARSPHQEKQKFELWYGSSAILAAAKAGLIGISDALDRMDLHHYGYAARVLGVDAAKVIAQRVESALISALGYNQALVLPDMTVSTPCASDSTPPLVSLSDAPSNSDLGTQLKRLSETEEQFKTRQDRLLIAFERFSTDLTSAEAELIISDMTLGGMKAVIEAAPDAGFRILERLSSASDVQLRHLHHVAVQVVVAMAEDSAVDKLLHRLAGLQPTINRVKGWTKVSAESLAFWRNAGAVKLRDYCKHRLITRQNDSEIALEVHAAYLGGQVAIVEESIMELLAADHPAETCLGLTIAGFSDQSAYAASVIAKFEGAQGFIGTAQQAASDAYRRNVWAKEWYERMRAAETSLDFWQSSVLLTKIVDERYCVWVRNSGPGTGVFQAFVPTIHREIKSRVEKWQKKRQDLLFGAKKPAEFFLRIDS